MSAYALISGVLHKTAEEKTTKAGKPYRVASIRVKDGDEMTWWRITVFSESAQAELKRLEEGEVLAVQGPFKTSTYVDKNGETKVGYSMTVDNVLAVKQPRKPKSDPDHSSDRGTRPKESRGYADRRSDSHQAPIGQRRGDGDNRTRTFDDDIPF